MVTVSEDNGTQLFRAAQVSIGMLGVLSKVTLRVENKFNLKEIRTTVTLNYCMDHLNELVEGDYTYVKMWVEFYNDLCVLYQTEKTDEPVTPLPWWISYLTVRYTI